MKRRFCINLTNENGCVWAWGGKAGAVLFDAPHWFVTLAEAEAARDTLSTEDLATASIGAKFIK